LAETELVDYLKTPLTEEESGRTFASDPHRFKGATAAGARAWLEGVVASGRLPTEQDRLLWAVARPERLLALASRYTVFEAGSRKIARYQQYFAVEDILARVRQRDESGARLGGLVWHTQGSGKSLTMVMLAEALLSEFASANPRVVLVTPYSDPIFD
jgi:type I restriction enzyme R subunit